MTVTLELRLGIFNITCKILLCGVVADLTLKGKKNQCETVILVCFFQGLDNWYKIQSGLQTDLQAIH